jgi:hypothetical protein
MNTASSLDASGQKVQKPSVRNQANRMADSNFI